MLKGLTLAVATITRDIGGEKSPFADARNASGNGGGTGRVRSTTAVVGTTAASADHTFLSVVT